MKIDDIPFQYAYCYATAKQCEQSNRCLRSHAARMNEEDLAMPREVLSCITPAYVNRVAAGETCIHFRSDTPLRYARGMKILFDIVPKGQYNTVRSKVINCFSCERVFYYAQKGEQLISPNEQEQIIAIFKNSGLSAPLFDKYELCPDWSI